MQQILTNDSLIGTLFTGVLSSALYALIALFWKMSTKRYGSRLVRLALPWWSRFSIGLILSIVFSIVIINLIPFVVHWTYVIISTCFVGLGISAYKSFRLSRVGIIDFDSTIKEGIDYATSLKSVKSSFRFLGTGASKLTSLPEFERAMLRCQSGSGAKFLLTHPDDPFLISAAQRAGIADPVAYKSRVRRSLEDLAALISTRQLNIEVRFRVYSNDSDIETFRMAFIDDAHCLFSYNAYGNGDGSDLPQIIIRKNSSGEEHKSFYYAMNVYFNNKWDVARPWIINDFYSSHRP